ncbi:alpha/beta hydrolase [Flavobacterium piscinae]|uniref:Alpha/beta hydrolase n=1 Tax=Flavobacterium piscinae TaxID=2506424 RepID=A0A4Q1KV46_9FLAO|nr:alpha/beta hydrolase-fold protein [Flavobacterium piscinae]MBC8883539.1 alpha/beta hydrolase [Flavobacterium piscinae]RXR34141.1 alpha/beta hydrolase [Flavobacterium piscinae]
MKLVQIIAVLFFALSGYAQKTVETFSSQKLGGDRDIYITLPPSYEKDNNQKFPLLLVLDGEYLFEPFQGALKFGNYWDDLPEVILVGISQNKQEERYADSEYDEESGLPIETGANFFDFIGTELMPYLQKTYRVAPFKIIAGHDTTAGFINFFLYKDNPIFDAFISLSPELALDMENRIPERLNAIAKPIYYYQSTADGDLKKIQKQTKELDEKVKVIQKETLNYKFDEFIGASHYSLVLHSIPNALYQFFAVYQPITTNEFNDKIVKLEYGYVEYLKEKYNTLEKTLNIQMPIRLNDFRAIEAAIVKNKMYNEFDELAILADKHYGKSMLSDYYMAQMYERKEDYKRAQKKYLSAFQKEPIGELTKDMMYDKSEEMKQLMN